MTARSFRSLLADAFPDLPVPPGLEAFAERGDDVTGVVCDSRRVAQGPVFVVLRGTQDERGAPRIAVDHDQSYVGEGEPLCRFQPDPMGGAGDDTDRILQVGGPWSVDRWRQRSAWVAFTLCLNRNQSTTASAPPAESAATG